MSAHPIQWQAPQPLWGRFGTTPAAAAVADDQKRPAILRFATDDFMEQMLATLARDPSRIDSLLARPESWRSPMSSSPDLIERTPVPVVAQVAKRSLFSRKPKQSVIATSHEADDPNSQVEGKKIPLKLYQPAHQRFYLVASSLVCGIPGLPERAIAPSQGELVNFVIRRLLPGSGGQTGDLHEFAYVKDAKGARWQRLAGDSGDQAAYGEDLLPVFPMAYQDDNARARTLWSGFVPVGRREEYFAADVDQTAPGPYAQSQREGLDIAVPDPQLSKMARVAQFQLDVAEPWKNLIRASVKLQGTFNVPVNTGGDAEPSPSPIRPKRILDFNLAQQNVSWLILLDFADYLGTHLEDLWNVIANGGAGYASLSQRRKDLYDWLGQPGMSPGLTAAMQPLTSGAKIRVASNSLRASLAAIRATGVRENLEATTLTYTADPASFESEDWPDFHFVLAGVDSSGTSTGPYSDLYKLDPSGTSPTVSISPDPAPQANDVDLLTTMVGRALDADGDAKAPPIPFALQVKNALLASVGDAGWFVIRFVHQRRDCGPLHPPTLSAPTQRFQLASFFDPDAPARPIRISMPMDTSPAGLRKYNKNTAFILSDMLCGQVQRAKGLGFIDLVLSVLPWPLHKDLDVGPGGPCSSGSLNIGMICSLSIPIITICALIILIIMVSLLDFIFRWMPFFIMCFPLPKFKGKS